MLQKDNNKADSGYVQQLAYLLKIIRERQQVFTQILTFISIKGMSSINDFHQLLLLSNFIQQTEQKHQTLLRCEKQFLLQFPPNQSFPKSEEFYYPFTRILLRVSEMIELGILKIKNAFSVSQSGQLMKKCIDIKKRIDGFMRGKLFTYKFIHDLIQFSFQKCDRFIYCLKIYSSKLQIGEIITFTQVLKFQNYHQKASKNSHVSPSKKKVKKVNKEAMKEEGVVNQLKNGNGVQKQENEFFWLYSIMDVSKKEFFENYIQEKKNEEKISSKLQQKNKSIKETINKYVQKSKNYQKFIQSRKISPKHKKYGDKDYLRKSFTMANEITKKNSLNIKDLQAISKVPKSFRKSGSNKRTKSYLKAKSMKKKEIVVKNSEEFFGANSLAKFKNKQSEYVNGEKGKKKEGIRFKRHKFSNPSQTMKKQIQLSYNF